MLVVFRTGEQTDNTNATFDERDVVDVIPRHKEAVIRRRGLGKKAGRFYWVEVDTDDLTDDEFQALADELLEPELEEIPSAPLPARMKKTVHKRYKVKRKRTKVLDDNELHKVDARFNKNVARVTRKASAIYPKTKLTVKQLRNAIVDKRTGRKINGN